MRNTNKTFYVVFFLHSTVVIRFLYTYCVVIILLTCTSICIDSISIVKDVTSIIVF